MSGPPVPSFARVLVMPVLVLATSACYPYVPPECSPAPNGSWSFHVAVPEERPGAIAVSATFENAGTDRLTVEPRSIPHVRDLESLTDDRGDVWRSVETDAGAWSVPSCRNDCTIRYRIDLAALAEACGDEVGCGRRVPRDAILSPALAWLVHPSSGRDVPVTVRIEVQDVTKFATGLRPATDSAPARHPVFSFRSADLDEGSFTAFGPMRRYPVDVAGRRGARAARVDLAVVGTAPYVAADVGLRSWVEDSASAVSALFGRFPVEQTTIFVVPAEGKTDVLFGRVLSLAGSSVAIVVGDKTPPFALDHDGVLVHELIHLGFPTFRGEGRWLMEGLATYYEPILRARAQSLSEAEVFQGFVRRMPRGEPPSGTTTALVDRRDLDGIYWGGAVFCLAADVRIRTETDGRRSLDDVVRATLDRGGDATRVWALRDVLRLGDRVTGTSVLTHMFERHAVGGERIDLDALFASLGVTASGEQRVVSLDDHASLARIRRDIVGGPSEKAVLVRGDWAW